VSDIVTFESDDLGVRFELDARFVQSAPLPDPPGLHVASAHFTLSMRGEWLAAFNVVEALSVQPVRTPQDLQREVEAFLTMQRHWDLSRTEILEPCHAVTLAGLPAWRTAHIIGPPRAGDTEFDAEALNVPVYTQQHAVFDGRRRIHVDLTVLPPERYALERETLDLPFRTLWVERRGRPLQ
jgi:hypothetical protein